MFHVKHFWSGLPGFEVYSEVCFEIYSNLYLEDALLFLPRGSLAGVPALRG